MSIKSNCHSPSVDAKMYGVVTCVKRYPGNMTTLSTAIQDQFVGFAIVIVNIESRRKS